MPTLKHLPLDLWPAADHAAFAAAYTPGELFDDTAGRGVDLAAGTRQHIENAYRRWLGFLSNNEPGALKETPLDRICKDRVRRYVEQLETQVRATTVATTIAGLLHAAQIIAPEYDWTWLRSVLRGLQARATPEDRFDRLVPGFQTLELGFTLMDEAGQRARKTHKCRDVPYRDGLLIALLSIWPIRRRSLASLTVTRHLERDTDGLTLLLHPEDTKSKRPESFRLPDVLVPYFTRYLDIIRPRLLHGDDHGGIWISYRGTRLTDDAIYQAIRNRILAAFGKAMCVHDFRRAAATFLAIEAPELIGLVPGVLQHSSPEVSEQHYNLARSAAASRRHGEAITKMRTALRPPLTSRRR